MKKDEQRKRNELLSGLRVPDNTWVIVRVDGKGFSKVTENRHHPFDQNFHADMVKAAGRLFEVYPMARLAVTHSDEISVVLPPEFDLFDRRVEKLLSISASAASAGYSLSAGHFGAFDARLAYELTEDNVIDYLKWRQRDCWRCFLNSLTYWTARDQGLSVRAATKLAGALPRDKHDYLFSVGINPNDRIDSEKRGSALRWMQVEHVGFNPITEEHVPTTRRRLGVFTPPRLDDDFEREMRETLQMADGVVARDDVLV